jgi:hypothetical protein
MSNTTIKGRVSVIGATQKVSDKFTKRDFVIETADQFPQLISLQVTQDKCGLLDSIKLGSEVTAHVNIRGRKWTDKEGVDKYFNTLECWKIETAAQTSQTAPVQTSNIPAGGSGGDGLPF